MGSALLFGGCAESLLVPPPSSTYRVEEGPPPSWTADERALAEQVNERLVQEGFPRAEPGSYETGLAALDVAMLRSKRWSTAGHKGDSTLALDTDEEEGVEYPKAHLYHRLLARGFEVPRGVWSALHADDFPKRRLWASDLDKLWPWLRPPYKPHAALRIGVAILGDGTDDKRYFGVVLRDDRIDLTEGPPRIADPGSTFALRGQIHDADMKPLKLAVEHPDGAVDFQIVDVAADGSFEASYQLPKQAGRYLVALGPGWAALTVPVFAGVPAAPWPARAKPDAVDPSTARDAVKELAKAFFTWRKGQSLPAAQLPSVLCAFAKLEAKRAADEATAPMTAERAGKDSKLRLQAAGLDPDKVSLWRGRASLSPADENNLVLTWENVVASVPWDPFEEIKLRSAQQLAVGAVPEPRKSDDDPAFVDFVWIGVEAPPVPSANR
ncbi:MAG: hypothetical protein ACYDCL_00025 [Myxococcales bacterium]